MVYTSWQWGFFFQVIVGSGVRGEDVGFSVRIHQSGEARIVFGNMGSEVVMMGGLGGGW